MKARTNREWVWPPLDQIFSVWSIPVAALIGYLFSEAFSIFAGLAGTTWMACYSIALLLGATGIGLILFAKLPLYREHRFFTFGPGVVPAERRKIYHLGYWCVAFSVALLSGLMLV